MKYVLDHESKRRLLQNAYEIHFRSHRKNKPYVTVNCGAVSDELAVSEFFDHQKGAFTGADSDKVGLFRTADRGTLFLDEVGSPSYKRQMLLLRALQEKRCKLVGSTKEYSFDIQLLAATNENLEKAMEESPFREDLFHHLNEFTFPVPFLRECREDILSMADFFLSLSCGKNKKHSVALTAWHRRHCRNIRGPTISVN